MPYLFAKPSVGCELCGAVASAISEANRTNTLGKYLQNQRSNNPVNWRSSVWFKSETTQYCIPLFVQARML